MNRIIARLLGSRRRLGLFAGLLATAALGGSASSALAATPISMASFPQVSGEDIIQMTYRNYVVPQDQIRVCLELGDGITWQKGIEWYKRERRTNWWGGTEFPFVFVQSVKLQDQNRSACMTQPLSSAYNRSFQTVYDSNRGGRLTFGKAKAFGIYTQMYDLQFDSASAVGGRAYTFRWVEDNGSQ